MAGRKPDKLLTKMLAELSTADDVRKRLHAAREIQRTAVLLEQAVVVEARAAGVTWTEIGEVFGMTKQAAQQRFKSGSTAKRRSG